MSRRTAGSVWSYPNVHGDVVATADGSGAKQVATTVYGPVGELLAGVVPDSVVGGMDAGWLGQHQRRSDAGSGRSVIQMGVRPYVPAAGRFLGVDPVEGGNANDYVYPQDPVNSFDLDGRMALPGGEWLCEGGGPAKCSPYSGKTMWSDLQFKKVGYKPNYVGRGSGVRCGWWCIIATGVTAIASFSAAGATCALTGPGGCWAAVTLAGSLTSVVYTASTVRNPSRKLLLCSAVFGSPGGDAAGLAVNAANGPRAVARQVLNSVAWGYAGKGAGC